MKSRSQIAVEALDEIASQCERRWGVDRLPRLVSVDLAERFYRQVEKLNDAISDECTGGSMANVEYEAGRMANAWRALDEAAVAAGSLEASGRCMGARMADGRSLVICEDREAMGVWQMQNAGQAAAVWTMEEVVAVLEGFDLVNRTKHLFEGAVVEDVRASRKVNWARGDELPDDLRLSLLGAG
jgi:hypothetical protein